MFPKRERYVQQCHRTRLQYEGKARLFSKKFAIQFKINLNRALKALRWRALIVLSACISATVLGWIYSDFAPVMNAIIFQFVALVILGLIVFLWCFYTTNRDLYDRLDSKYRRERKRMRMRIRELEKPKRKKTDPNLWAKYGERGQ